MHLKHEDVTFGRDGAVLRMYRTKTLLFKNRVLSILIPAIPNSVLCPVSALRCHMSSNPAAPRTLCFPCLTTRAIDPSASAFLKCCIEFLNLDKNSSSMHSFRRGGATFAFRAGVPAEFIESQGDWASDAYLIYLIISTAVKHNVMQSITARLQGH